MEKATEALRQDSLALRCQTLSEVIPTLPVRQLHIFLPQLLSNIFGYDGTPGWKLSSLHGKFHPTDFKAIRGFLKPNGGCLFKALQCLECDSSSHFLFPFSAIPPNSAALLCDRALPMPYRLFVTVDIQNKELSMTAFHYYFMYFTYFLINPPAGVVWPTDLADVLYTQLVDDYLNYLLPPGNPIPNSGGSSSKFVPNTHTLSQAFAEIIYEMWLNQRGSEVNQVTLTIDQVRIIRMLVKHSHRFLFTSQLVKDRVTEEVASYIATSFQTNATEFLSYHFATWPLISSFRGLMETWLSFIQPWRYATAIPGNLTDRNLPDWTPFIRDNLAAYCNLLDRSLRRMAHSVICSGKNVTLLSRVLKVFNNKALQRTISSLEVGHVVQGIVPVFTECSAAQDLLDKLSAEISHAERQITRGGSGGPVNGQPPHGASSGPLSGAFSWLSEGLFHNPDELDGQQKTLDNLKSSVSQLQGVFQISPSCHVTSISPTEQSGPDFVMDALNRRRLTPQGRSKMVAGTLRLDYTDITTECNPALRPICSYENPHLVRALYQLSLKVSTAVSKHLRVLYATRGPLQTVMRPFIVQVKEDVSEEGALLLNLRPVASYRFIFYSCLVIFLSYLCSVNPLLVVAYFGLCIGAVAFASSIVTPN